ncbi:dienelactone hydrolase family protein [Pseudactinotalea sp. HY160]|uniref:dienelactone hydrolase family protein n=1 Tax=Pseudactinotalea sp. HY160 TaxID=2654490 RepID=UPI00128E5E5B|nr:dienelactone hydrolase family protein [Pseudactinotalea sp. HY160]MPV50580.1 dienelactone hydrolase family protein [Pseudactinotalea sp. HY160]
MSQPTSHVLPRPGGDLPVLRWHPAGLDTSPAAGVVLVQEIFGVTDYIRTRAADLARAGYTVDVPVLFFRESSEPVPEDAPDLLERGLALAAATDWDTAVADTRATVARLSRDLAAAGPDSPPVTLLGFCYGGGLAYAAAAETAETPAPREPAEHTEPPASALVSYYGSALPALTAEPTLRVERPSLHHFGTADAYVPLEAVRAIRERVTAARAPVEFHLYDGAGHAFDNPIPRFHHARASAEAWRRTLVFLDRVRTA